MPTLFSKEKLFLPMKLQLFADPEGAEDLPPAEDTPPSDPAGNKESEKSFSRDELAKIVAAETSKAVTAAEEKWRNEKAEADKLAEMNEKDKADYERQKLEEKIAEYEKKDNLAKMADKASEMLSDKGATPTKEILGLIVSEDAETTSSNVKAYLAAVELERESIKADFEKRLGGKVPLDGTGATSLSRGAQMAKEANSQAKQPENDLWSAN